MAAPVTLTHLDPVLANDKAHHIGSPPTKFHNPWPSAVSKKHSLIDALMFRFRDHPEKTNTPLPLSLNGERSKELVRVQRPDWGAAHKDKLRATWIGHASSILEMPAAEGASRGVRIAVDPVFADRMSPVSFAGPKRFTPTPCTVDELPDIDVVLISHNHYDHLDSKALSAIYARNKGRVHIISTLNSRQFFTKNVGSTKQDTTALDWWDSVRLDVPDVKSSVTITCCPAQHGSRRGLTDGNKSLWCSFAIASNEAGGKNLWFAGDTGYQTVDAQEPCPAFKQIGDTLGPFDLGLVPIGCFKPASILGEVHASPWQSIEIHKDVKSRLSIGMHWGTLRGTISEAFEAVQDPGRAWKLAAQKQDLWCGGGPEGDGSPLVPKDGGVGLCDIGETIAV